MMALIVIMLVSLSGIVDDISDLKVENPTIVKVSNKKIIEFYSGSEEVNSILD